MTLFATNDDGLLDLLDSEFEDVRLTEYFTNLSCKRAGRHEISSGRVYLRLTLGDKPSIAHSEQVDKVNSRCECGRTLNWWNLRSAGKIPGPWATISSWWRHGASIVRV